MKLKYYELMIQHALKNDAYLDVTKYYYKVWETPSIKEDENGKGKAVCRLFQISLQRLISVTGIGAYCILYRSGPARQRTVGYVAPSVH